MKALTNAMHGMIYAQYTSFNVGTIQKYVIFPMGRTKYKARL